MRCFGTFTWCALLALSVLDMVYDGWNIKLYSLYDNGLGYYSNIQDVEGLERGLTELEETSDELPEKSMEEVADGKKELCFINASFGKSKAKLDTMWNMTSMHDERFGFFFFTNLEDLKAPGWDMIVLDLPYKRFVTQSRWPKFMAWKHPTIAKSCKTVLYFDAIGKPRISTENFISAAKKCRSSEFGLLQLGHPSKTISQEFELILRFRKDMQKNIDASMEWFKKQPDFHEEVKSWRNDQFLYDLESDHYKKAAEFFWERYSLELDSWRDQPLWWYTLQHFNITPGSLYPDPIQLEYGRMGHGGHSYKVDNDAEKVK